MKPSSVIDQLASRNPFRIDIDAAEKLSSDARDLLQTILSTPRTGVVASPVVLRHHRARTRRILSAGVLSAGVVVGLAASCLALAGVFTVTPKVIKHHPSRITPLSAVVVLDSAVKAAIAQPILPALGPGQYYYERDVISVMDICRLESNSAGKMLFLGGGVVGHKPDFVYVQTLATEQWSLANFSGGASEQVLGGGHFLTASQEAAWKAAGSPSGCSYGSPQSLPSTPSSAPTTGGSGGVGDLPTNPAALAALIAAGRVNDIGQVSTAPPDGKCPSQAGDAPKVYPPGAVCAVSAQFDIAQNLLGQPEGPERVGPALYEILTKLPGVENIGQRTDALGRTGTAIEDPSTGIFFLIDPTTGSLLEQGQMTLSAGVNSEVPVGTVTYATTFGPASIVNGYGVKPSTGNTGAAGSTGAIGNSGATGSSAS